MNGMNRCMAVSEELPHGETQKDSTRNISAMPPQLHQGVPHAKLCPLMRRDPGYVVH